MNNSSKKSYRFLPFFLLPAAVLILSVSLLFPGSSSENRKFDTYTDDLFRQEVTASTINLHYTLADPDSCGIADYPISFGSVANGDVSAYESTLSSHAASLAAFDESQLSKENQLTLSILKQSCQAGMDCPEALYMQEPLSPSLGIQAQLPVLLAEYTFRTSQDVLDYLKLLKALPEYFQNIISLEQAKSEKGLFMNDRGADGVISQCQTFIENPDDNYLIPVFNEKVDALSFLTETERQSCKDLHNRLIRSSLVPAYQILIDGVTALKGTGKNENGLAWFEDGPAYYAYLLRTQVGTEDSPNQVEKRLYQQLISESKEMQQLLTANPSLLSDSGISSEPLEEPTKILDTLKEQMSGDFPVLPETDYEVKYVHKDLQKYSSPAFYLTPPVDTNSPNAIYINPYANMQGSELFTTLAHEGFPGHLYQTVYFSQTNPPLIRHLYAPSGYIEGWATYVESYAYGYYAGDADKNRLLWLNRSMNLCLYSLLDLGIHYHGWNAAETAAFLSKFGVTDTDISAQIFEYIIETPANYLKYYYGYLNFLDLRDACMKKEGADFQLKKFHQKLLELGPMPFSILKEQLL